MCGTPTQPHKLHFLIFPCFTVQKSYVRRYFFLYYERTRRNFYVLYQFSTAECFNASPAVRQIWRTSRLRIGVKPQGILPSVFQPK